MAHDVQGSCGPGDEIGWFSRCAFRLALSRKWSHQRQSMDSWGPLLHEEPGSSARPGWLWAWLLAVGMVGLADAKNVQPQHDVGGDSVPTTNPDVPEEAEYDPSILDRTLENNRLVEAMIRTEVQNELRHARVQMAASPQSVQEALKLMLERVRRAPELSAEGRAQLRGQLETALRESARRSVEQEERDIESEQAQAQADERLRIVQSLDRRQEKLRQLMDRFDSLMAEGRYLLAEETAAYEVQQLRPICPTRWWRRKYRVSFVTRGIWPWPASHGRRDTSTHSIKPS